MKVLDIKELDDGGAILSLDLTEEETSMFVNIGVQKVLRDYAQEILDKENTKRFDE